MAKTVAERQRSVADRAVEFQMGLQRVLAQAASARDRREPVEKRFHPYLTVSRQAASAGAEVARLVGDRLGWSVLDRELVEILATQLKVSPDMLTLLDETRANWIADTLYALVDSRLVLQDSYVALLGRILLACIADRSAVVVGRGANFLLPPQHGIRLRTVAPEAFRVEYLMRQKELDRRAAVRHLREIEAQRTDFIRHHFHADPDDVHVYDMVLDISAFGIEGSAELVIRALRLRFGDL